MSSEDLHEDMARLLYEKEFIGSYPSQTETLEIKAETSSKLNLPFYVWNCPMHGTWFEREEKQKAKYPECSHVQQVGDFLFNGYVVYGEPPGDRLEFS
jgi:hypothetical protein